MSSVSKSLLGAAWAEAQDAGWKTMDSSTKAKRKHNDFFGDDAIFKVTILTALRL